MFYWFTGSLKIWKLKIDDGAEPQDVTEPIEWCTTPNNQKLVVGDWNGDGFTDLLCHKQSGEMEVLINQAGHRHLLDVLREFFCGSRQTSRFRI